MDITALSARYRVRRLTPADAPVVYALCRENSLYYQHCPPLVTEQSIISDMSALPPRKTLSDKYYVGYFDGEKLIAVMDLILSFPDEPTAFIGFYMTDVSVQRAGIGSGIIDERCNALPAAGYHSIRLGWVKGNPQAESFWHKNGFTETGVTYDTDSYTGVASQRNLYISAN